MSALTMDGAKAHLGITNDASDIELQDTIDAAEAAIGKRVGPLSPTTLTARVPGGRTSVVLPVTPVVSVTSMTSVGIGSYVLTTDFLILDTAAGVLSGLSFPAPAYDVVYVAGWSTVPSDLLYAVKEMVRHLWRTQRGAGGRPGAAGAEPTASPTYLIPFAVAELLEPYMPAGFA